MKDDFNDAGKKTKNSAKAQTGHDTNQKTDEEIQQIKKKAYNEYVKQVTPAHSCALNTLNAFISGGIICLLGQCLLNFFESYGHPHEIASAYVTLCLIFISVVLTGFNLVTPIVKFAGAGYLVPITGFANSVAACAIEYKKEGQVFGVGSKIFTIAGPVIIYGMVSSAFFGLIFYLLMVTKLV